MKVKVNGIHWAGCWRYVIWCPRCQVFPGATLYLPSAHDEAVAAAHAHARTYSHQVRRTPK
jgi:hypothetical protein